MAVAVSRAEARVRSSEVGGRFAPPRWAEGLAATRDAGRTRVVRIARPGGGEVAIGGGRPFVVAGPCAVESRDGLLEAAAAVAAAGADALRAGAFKPRTSPHTFQGLGAAGLDLLAEARAATGLPVVTEVMEPGAVELVARCADVLQVGSRNMQNTPLLREVGRARKPVLLKRGFAATIEEWVLAAEYVLSEGNPHVILCERGVRTFEPYTRNTLDLGGAVAARMLTHLPVIADPSHGSGRSELVRPLARAALAAGLDGLIVEVHPRPAEAISDAVQTIDVATFAALIGDVARG